MGGNRGQQVGKEEPSSPVSNLPLQVARVHSRIVPVGALGEKKRNVPRPREATSVAIKIGERPALNSPRTQSRSRLRKSHLDANSDSKHDPLFFVSVYRQSGPTILPQIFRDIISNPFSPYKNQDFGIFRADLIQVLDQFRPLLEIAADLDDLLDVMIRG